MPHGHSWNLQEWLRALGIKRADQPDVAQIVQPVEIVGDHSGFTSQILPPMAWMGGTRGGVALVYSGCQLVSRAAGGTYIRILIITQKANAEFGFHIAAAPSVMANGVAAMTVSDFGSTPTTSRLQLGTFAALPSPAATTPKLTPQFGGVQISDLCLIPPGSVFEAWNAVAGNDMHIALLFEDCPAIAGAR